MVDVGGSEAFEAELCCGLSCEFTESCLELFKTTDTVVTMETVTDAALADTLREAGLKVTESRVVCAERPH